MSQSHGFRSDWHRPHRNPCFLEHRYIEISTLGTASWSAAFESVQPKKCCTTKRSKRSDKDSEDTHPWRMGYQHRGFLRKDFLRKGFLRKDWIRRDLVRTGYPSRMSVECLGTRLQDLDCCRLVGNSSERWQVPWADRKPVHRRLRCYRARVDRSRLAGHRHLAPQMWDFP